MRYIDVLQKILIKVLIILLLACLTIFSTFSGYTQVISYLSNEDEIKNILEDYFRQRGVSLVSGDPSYIEGQFDTASTYGRWSYEHEIKRIKYIKSWSQARGITFKECEPKIKILSTRKGQDSVRLYLSVRTRFSYVYNDIPDITNEFCLGTKHTIKLINKSGVWYVTVDWYSDPLEDSGVAGTTISVDQQADQQETGAFSYSRARYNRTKAVEYADRYCGALFEREDGYKYNPKYRNYADLGGDCANFASQTLADKNAGNLRMGGGWLYARGSASSSWVNAGSFTKHMVYSGKAKLISRGKYKKVVNFTHHIGPGDLVSYEKKGGDIVHVSIVTAKDSKGVPLVNSHTNDRYHVPWDLGWGSSDVNFWFLRVND